MSELTQLYTEIAGGICDGSHRAGCSRFDELYTWLLNAKSEQEFVNTYGEIGRISALLPI